MSMLKVPTFGFDNFGVGIDTKHGTVPELFKWDGAGDSL